MQTQPQKYQNMTASTQTMLARAKQALAPAFTPVELNAMSPQVLLHHFGNFIGAEGIALGRAGEPL